MGSKFLLQGFFLIRDYNNKVGMLAASIVNAILAALASFRIDVVLLLIESIAVGMTLSVAYALRWIGQQIRAMFDAVGDAFKAFRDIIDTVEFIGDVILAALAWRRFLEL